MDDPAVSPTHAGPQAAERTVEFFTAQIRNPHTRAAYAAAVTRFFTWCDARGLALAQISPIAVATYIEEMHGRSRSAHGLNVLNTSTLRVYAIGTGSIGGLDAPLLTGPILQGRRRWGKPLSVLCLSLCRTLYPGRLRSALSGTASKR